VEYVLVFILIGLILLLMPKGDEIKQTNNLTDKLVIEKKKCPPHQWFWQEIVDQDGVRQGERIVCKICGPLASQSGREET